MLVRLNFGCLHHTYFMGYQAQLCPLGTVYSRQPHVMAVVHLASIPNTVLLVQQIMIAVGSNWCTAARASYFYASTRLKLVCATVRHCKGIVTCCRAVNEGSPLSGQLEAGDNIWMLNQCPVTSSRSWLDCLATSNFHDTADHSRSPR